MIGLNENLGGPPEFSVSNLMRSLEQELAGKPVRSAREAQELVYDAWEASSDERERELLTEALQIDPGNTDAAPRDPFVFIRGTGRPDRTLAEDPRGYDEFLFGSTIAQDDLR
jgi:hypothetical protein